MTEQNTIAPIVFDMPLIQQDWVTYRRFWRIADPYGQWLKWVIFSLLCLTFPLTVYFNITLPSFTQITPNSITMDLTPMFVHGAILFVLLYRHFVYFKKQYHKNINLKSMQRHMEFGQTSLNYTSVYQTGRTVLTREYQDLKNVFETKDYLYIIDSRTLRMILRKDTLAASDLATIKTRLQNAIGDRYILVK